MKDPLAVHVTELAAEDVGYALASWREAHHQTPNVSRIPWPAYKQLYGQQFERILRDPGSLTLGAYTDDELVGFLAATPGKRVDVLHWVQVKFKNRSGEHIRRRGVMTALLEAAELGDRFVYTLRARRDGKRTLDDILADKLAARGVVAVYSPFREWLKD